VEKKRQAEFWALNTGKGAVSICLILPMEEKYAGSIDLRTYRRRVGSIGYCNPK
jgi:hypothetical protein